MGKVGTISIYECDVCHQQSEWGQSWSQKTVLHDYWDEVVTVCSEACAQQFDERHKEKRGRKKAKPQK